MDLQLYKHDPKLAATRQCRRCNPICFLFDQQEQETALHLCVYLEKLEHSTVWNGGSTI
jgi:hypothetical protein